MALAPRQAHLSSLGRSTFPNPLEIYGHCLEQENEGLLWADLTFFLMITSTLLMLIVSLWKS